MKNQNSARIIPMRSRLLFVLMALAAFILTGVIAQARLEDDSRLPAGAPLAEATPPPAEYYRRFQAAAPPTDPVCNPPGLSILTDPLGDTTGGAPSPAHDVRELFIQQPFAATFADAKIVFRIKMESLANVPPNTFWPSNFCVSGSGFPCTETGTAVPYSATNKYYGVRMSTVPPDSTGPPVFQILQPTAAGTTAGTRAIVAAQPGSGFTADGMITIVAKASDLGLTQAGLGTQQLGPFQTRIAVNFVAATLTPDNMPDAVANGGGLFTTVSMTNCQPVSGPQADLSITKTDGATTYTPGGTTNYTIVASNAGPDAATNAVVTDVFPSAITSANWTCTGTVGTSCPALGSGNINSMVTLPSGGSVTFSVNANISGSATGTLVNTAAIAAPAGVNDPNTLNNSATDTNTQAAGPSADLSITKTDGAATYTPGGTTTYTIVASNAGPNPVTNALVADTFPSQITSANWTCVGAAGGVCSASGSGNIGDSVNLPVGGSVTYTVTANISASATGNMVNTATVETPGGVTDSTPTNNSATDTNTQAGSACPAASTPPAGATFSVTSNADTGAGTLRQAILDANTSMGSLNTITFSGVTTIALLTPLPAITDPVMIDGGATPTVELNGSGTPNNNTSIGLHIKAGGSTIRGMVINRFFEAGVRADCNGSNVIIGNRIGTNTAGTAALGNFNRGILIVGPSTGNMIGNGTTAGNNLISGNAGRGIDINAGGSATVTGNLIGTNAAGTGDLGNTNHGIQIVNSSNSTIGGTTTGARNVISGNTGSGVFVIGDVATPASNNVISGNFIGVDSGGNTAIPNTGSGVTIQGGSNTVGGTTVGARNVISGNGTEGVAISTTLATLNVVAGNLIGVGANGTASIPNGNNGIRIASQAANNMIGSAMTTPGMCNNACNVIANNGTNSPLPATTAEAGVYVDNTAGVGNSVIGNSIFSNGLPSGLGIDLAFVGVTANDAGDPDAGPNGTQNKPVITSANDAELILGTLNSTPNTTFSIHFYSNTAADGLNSEGRTYIGLANITTDGSGNSNIGFITPTPLMAGQYITTTATRFASPFDTSEFSDAVQVLAATAASVTVSGRVTTAAGMGIRNVVVYLTASDGTARGGRTNAFGYYAIDGVESGHTYTATAAGKRYQFVPRVVTINDSISDLDFSAASSPGRAK